ESFRIGYTIVRVATAPVRLFRGLRRDASNQPPRADKHSDAAETPAHSAEPAPIVSVLAADEVEQLYAAGGADAVIAAVSSRADTSPEALGAALIQTSRQMIQSGFSQAEYPLVAKALQLHRSDQTLRAMYWAAQKAGKINEAWNYLCEIEELYGLNPTPSHGRWLEKARNGPIMNLALFDEIVTAPGLAFVPI